MNIKIKMFIPIVLGYVLICNQLVFGKVIIIGAGASGIAAASKLAEKGYNDFIILEAENRIGGRIFSTEFGKSNKKVDLGAQWIHGQGGNVAYEMVKSLGLTEDIVFNISDMSFSHSSISNVNQTNVINIVEYLEELDKFLDSTERTSDSKGNLMMTEIFKRQIPTDENYSSQLLLPETNSVIDWYEISYNLNDAATDSWFGLSPTVANDYQDTEGITTVTWIDGGYHNILDILMGNNAAMIKEKTHLNKEVATIYWKQRPTDTSGIVPQPGHVLVRCSDGTIYAADHVIVTTSLGVLKNKVHSLFRPSLPDNKLIAIKGLGFGTIDKIYLEFTEPWWSSTDRGFSFLWSEEDKSNFTFPEDGSKTTSTRHWLTGVLGYYKVDFHPNILCGWVVGDVAHQMELASHSEVLEGSEYLLRRFFGHQYNITKPIKLLRTTWFKNPHFRGSYSNRIVESNILKTNSSMLAEPITNSNGKPILLFAGEATNTKHRATVHGAIETGWREVERLTPWLASK